MRPPLLVALVALTATAADTATKSWAAVALHERPVQLAGGLVLRESRNPGAAFSLATDWTVLLTLVALAAVIGTAVYARRLTRPLPAVALGLIAGGAAGNLIDRLFRAPGPFRGAVVDWVDVGWWPSFNLADVWITTGAALLVLVSLRGERAAEPETSPDRA